VSQRILLLGATSGIAQEVGRCFAAGHARLFLVARDAQKLEVVAGDLRNRGAEAVLTAAADFDELAAHPALVAAVMEPWGGLDMALIAHGTLPDQKLCEIDPAALQRAWLTNCTSVISLASLLGEAFEKQGSGVLAVIGSVAGDRARRSNYVYGAAKGAVHLFLDGLRMRLAGSNVSVVTIKPGWVSTPMTAHLPQNFLYARPEPAGRAICRAMQARRRVVYVPWFWRWIMVLIRAIPKSIFARMKV
jgi:decaprenylphospho-beta-D-erythro-pentofuranosid-2-ulose 2-reductase